MAKKDKNEDEYKSENRGNTSNQDDEDFGLPNLDDDSDEKEDLGSPEEETSRTSTYIEEEEATESTYYADAADEPVYEDSVYEDQTPDSGGYIPPKKPSLVPVFILLSIVVIVACLVVYFLFIRKSEPEIVEKPVVQDTTYVVEKPIAVVEPEIVEPEGPKIGVVNTLSSRTGRSYVVVGSFFDDDMAQDYADELAQDGISSFIIPPFGKSKFNRVAIEETTSFADASSRATELAGQFKETPWPLKY
jgi:hypothetical protein